MGALLPRTGQCGSSIAQDNVGVLLPRTVWEFYCPGQWGSSIAQDRTVWELYCPGQCGSSIAQDSVGALLPRTGQCGSSIAQDSVGALLPRTVGELNVTGEYCNEDLSDTTRHSQEETMKLWTPGQYTVPAHRECDCQHRDTSCDRNDHMVLPT